MGQEIVITITSKMADCANRFDRLDCSERLPYPAMILGLLQAILWNEQEKYVHGRTPGFWLPLH
jgi:hypothetical protein